MFKLRDEATANKILAKIKAMDVDYKFMHVCGTHQDTMVRFGLDGLLRDVGVEIKQGPGCPVCVTTSKEIADAITLARSGVTVCAFGDMMRVPTTIGTLNDAKADGADVRIVYSIEDAVRMASEQKKDLTTAIDELLADIAAGRKYMKVYRQMKMYNDPSLNPVLYGAGKK